MPLRMSNDECLLPQGGGQLGANVVGNHLIVEQRGLGTDDLPQLADVRLKECLATYFH